LLLNGEWLTVLHRAIATEFCNFLETDPPLALALIQHQPIHLPKPFLLEVLLLVPKLAVMPKMTPHAQCLQVLALTVFWLLI